MKIKRFVANSSEAMLAKEQMGDEAIIIAGNIRKVAGWVYLHEKMRDYGGR